MAGPLTLSGPSAPGAPGRFEPRRVFRSSNAKPVVVPGIAPVAPANGAPDLVTQARSRLVEQYKGKPKLVAVIDTLLFLLQDLANAAAGIAVLDDLDQAGGVNLDVTAELVGQRRTLPGYTVIPDDFLRALTRLRIIRNSAQGTAPEIITGVAALLGNDGTQIVYASRGLMYVEVQFERAPTMLEIAAFRADLLPRPAGVTLVVAWFNPARHFGWNGDATAVGFGEQSDPTKGGCFGEIVTA